MIKKKLLAIKNYLKTSWHLIKTDWVAWRKNLLTVSLDTAIYVGLIVWMATYILPLLGTSAEYGSFIAFGAIPSACIFEIYGLATQLVVDIRKDKLISYRLTLPIPSVMVFIAKGCAFALRLAFNAFTAGIISISIPAIGGKLVLTYFSLPKFFLICTAMVIFSGFLVLFVGSLVKKSERTSSIWNRTLYPLWFFGGSQFSWHIMHNFSPVLSWITIFDPFLYLTEGLHSAALNPANYLNFWFCLSVMVVLTFFFGSIGIYRLKKQLSNA